MLKKILILLSLWFLFFVNFEFVNWDDTPIRVSKNWTSTPAVGGIQLKNDNQIVNDILKSNWETNILQDHYNNKYSEIKKESEAKQKAEDAAKEKALKERNAACDSQENCMDRASYKIEASSLFDFWWKTASEVASEPTTKDRINHVLWELIQKMMIVLWVISLVVMTIWSWYMIIYYWQDEYLSKWKSIFLAWIIALVVALTSYYMISLIRYIVFNN